MMLHTETMQLIPNPLKNLQDKFLKDYQEAHPKDEDLRNALSALKQDAPRNPAAPAPSAPKPASQKAGGLNLAG